MKRGILELKLNKEEVIFHTKDTSIEIPNLDTFLYGYTEPGGTMVFIDEKYIRPIIRHIQKTNPSCLKETKLFKKKLIGFRIEDKQRKFSKSFYELKFKLGTNELSIEDALKLIDDIPSRYNQGYTSVLRQQIKTDETFLNFTVGYSQPSLSQMIYAKTYKEFINVKCFDITSFYPYLLTQELPHYDKMIDTSEMDLNDKSFTYYGAIKITNLKAKTSFCPLTLVGNEKDIPLPNQGKNIFHLGTRIIAADEVLLYGFIPFLLDCLKEYEYESCLISSQIARFQLRKDEGLRSLILEKFQIKQNKKRQGLDYLGEKILLNRLYGFFITKGNRAAAHYSQYIVQKGKSILLNIIREIGLKDVVHSHTDSIKFVGNHEDVINAYNEKIEFEELGRFDNEGIMEKVVYYGVNKAKYIKDGKLNFKHGGIETRDIEPFMEMGYDNIDRKTKYNLTISYDYISGLGLVANTIEKEFGGSVSG